MTSLIGRQFGRYTIQQEVGRGGMARVYRARDTQLKRIVALKVLAPQLALDAEFIQRFDREAVIAANLQHPNIVTIYDVGEYEGLRCIAMEYIQGRTLHALIQERGALGLVYAIPIIAAVASALDYAHTQGAVHRDIKPHNIMVSADGRILLTDFGIAQAPEARGGERLTRTGIFMGTPEYISPEQASAQRVDGRSDLYSLGITAYEMITGKVPFSGATPQLMLAHLQLPPPPLSSVIADQPPELDLVLARALAKSPDKRYATGAAFVTALREVARSYQIVEATTAELAFLAQPESSSGQLTQAIDRGQTQPSPAPVRPPKPPVQDRQRPTPPPVEPSDPNIIPRKPAQSVDWRIVVPIAIGVILLVILALSATIGSGQRPRTQLIPSPSPLLATIVPTEQPTSTPNPTAIPPTVLPSATPTDLPAPTVRPTRRPPIAPTEVPVEIPTEFIPEPTIEIPTETPTEIPTEIPTATIVPITAIPVATTAILLPMTAVPLPTATSVPPTATSVPTTAVVVPTTAVVVLPTVVPPTATVDVPTATSVLPTATINIPTVTLTLTP